MNVLFWLSIDLGKRSPSEHLLIAIIEQLYSQGHAVHVLQKDSGGEVLPASLGKLGVTTTKIRSVAPAKNNFAARYLADVKYILSCQKWLKENTKFDRVFLQSSNVAGLEVFLLNKHLKSVPVVFNVQDVFPENAVYSKTLSAKSIVYKMLSTEQKYAYKNVDRIITISEDMKDQLVALGVAPKKIEVIYNWSYQDQMYDAASMDCAQVQEMLKNNSFNVVYAGNIGMMQNVESVIRAAALMREEPVRFHIIGDGLYKEKLIALAKQLNAENVTFWNMLPTTLAPALYASADINIIPLAEGIYKTALPSKTATCVACNRPIILAIGKDSKFGKMFEDETGYPVVESNSPQEIVQAIKQIRAGKFHDMKEFFYGHFLKSKNSRCYLEEIVRGRNVDEVSFY